MTSTDFVVLSGFPADFRGRDGIPPIAVLLRRRLNLGDRLERSLQMWLFDLSILIQKH